MSLDGTAFAIEFSDIIYNFTIWSIDKKYEIKNHDRMMNKIIIAYFIVV